MVARGRRESYLPLLDMLDRLVREGIRAPITLSISPPLIAMLGDSLLRRRFEDHLDRLARLATALRSGGLVDDRGQRVLQFYEARLASTRRIWERCGGDLVGALVGHAKDGAVEILTSTATHAYLPGLLTSPASIRAQLRLGIRSFEKLSGLRPRGLWLPGMRLRSQARRRPCRSGRAVHGPRRARNRACLAGSPLRHLRANPLPQRRSLLRPRSQRLPRGLVAPDGLPGGCVYREFYRDVGFDLPASALAGEVGPMGPAS